MFRTTLNNKFKTRTGTYFVAVFGLLALSANLSLRASELTLQTTKNILYSSNATVSQKLEVKEWLGKVQKLIVNSAAFKSMLGDEKFKKEYSKATYAFCIDSLGMPIGIHCVSKDAFSEMDERIATIVESCGPFPSAPNSLPWSLGGMRVELTLSKNSQVTLTPDWPNTRLAAAQANSL